MYATANNLTLTNVVFESNNSNLFSGNGYNLTLTNVVFEFIKYIWIILKSLFYLTLTNVVFELILPPF